jgi:hypothetical protein
LPPALCGVAPVAGEPLTSTILFDDGECSAEAFQRLLYQLEPAEIDTRLISSESSNYQANH